MRGSKELIRTREMGSKMNRVEWELIGREDDEKTGEEGEE